MRKNILVTGGAGFVGSHLVDALVALGHNVRVLDNLTPQVHGGNRLQVTGNREQATGDRLPVTGYGEPEIEGGNIPDYLSREAELMLGDIRDPGAVARSLEGMEIVYHLASAVGVGQSMYEIAHYMETNTQGTANLLQALLRRKSRVEKLILASSMSIYGEGKYLCRQCGEAAPPLRGTDQLKNKQWETLCPQCGEALRPIPTDEPKPLQCSSIYALSKKNQEEMCLLFGRTYGLPMVALRYFNIYGTRQALSNPYTGVAAIFASRLLNGNPPLVFEDGKQMRDFVNVKDIVQANLLAMERQEADGLAVNIGSGNPVSIGEVATGLAQALGTEMEAELTGKYRAGDIRHCFADITLAKERLGYEPKMSFVEGTKELVNWLRLQQPGDRADDAAAELSNFGLTA